MKTKSLFAVLVLISSVALVAAGCSSTTTMTVTAPASQTTVTIPGGVTTVPGTTITLKSTTTVLAPTTVTYQPVTLTPASQTPAAFGFLPEVAIPLNSYSHMASLVTALTGLCLQCHGPTLYLQAPMPPTWDGTEFGSTANPGIYLVTPGSIQDHTNYTATQCLTCHYVQ